MENRNGLVTGTRLTQATGTAEREAVDMAEEIAMRDGHRVTVGADKAYDTHDFVRDLRDLKVTPHVAQNTKNRSSAIDGRTTRHAGLHPQPTEAQTSGRDLRLDQDRGVDAQDPTSGPGSGGMDVHLHCGCLQPGADSKPRGSRVLRQGKGRVPGPLEPEQTHPERVKSK